MASNLKITDHAIIPQTSSQFQVGRALTIFSGLCAIAHPLGLRAQTPTENSILSTDPQHADATVDKLRIDEIVVTAPRLEKTWAESETEFDEHEIASQGADTVQQLLGQLSAFINPNGTSPLILINGRPAGFDRSILSYPPEALAGLTVLNHDAAMVYGASPGTRVVNLLLKSSFMSSDAETGVSWATRGGQSGHKLNMKSVTINGDTRWNVQFQYARDSNLLKSARHFPLRAGVFDNVGYVASLDGGPIAPEFASSLQNDSFIAAIPLLRISGRPTLDDFATTVGKRHDVDPNTYETLRPSQETFGLSAGITRPLGIFSLSFNVNANSNSHRSRRGLPMTFFILPSDSLWSPFAQDVALVRPFAGNRALHSGNDAQSLDASLTLSGMLDGWLGSLAIRLGKSWSSSLLETRADVTQIQKLIEIDQDFNPFGAWDPSLLLVDRNRSHNESLTAQLNLQKAVATLPTGPISLSLTADFNHDHIRQSQATASEVATMQKVSHERASGQISIVVPLSGRTEQLVGSIGELSFNMTLGGQILTDTHPQLRYGGGLEWAPVSSLRLRAGIEQAETAPPFASLNAPMVTTVDRIFDFAQQKVAEPIWITGGNPDLWSGTRQTLIFSAMLRPFKGEALSLNIDYQRTRSLRGFSSFPALTPAVEAAFPDRVSRDAMGQLISIDARPINIGGSTEATLSSGVVYRIPGAPRDPGAKRDKIQSAITDPLHFNISLSHKYRIASVIRIRPGVPVIDQLAGSGRPRHSIDLGFGIGRRETGATLNMNWSSAARVGDRVNDLDNAFRITPPFIVNFSAFIELAAILRNSDSRPIAKGWKLTLDVQNLLDGYRHVTRENGAEPAGFSRDEVDPLGRTIQLTLRKRF